MLAQGPLRNEHAPGRIDHRAGDDVNHRSAGTLAPTTALVCTVAGQPLACCKAPWQCLYFLPDPQGHASLRPTLGMSRTNGAATGAAVRGSGGSKGAPS